MAKKNSKSETADKVLAALVAAVLDINKVLGFEEQPIKTEGATVDQLETEVRGVFSEIKPGDKFTPDTWKELTRLGYVAETTPPTAGKKTTKVEETPAKVEKTKSPGKSTKKTSKEPGAPSNKQLVYKEWKGGTKDVQKLLKVVSNAVKEVTVKSWTSAWGRGKDLPKGAK